MTPTVRANRAVNAPTDAVAANAARDEPDRPPTPTPTPARPMSTRVSRQVRGRDPTALNRLQAAAAEERDGLPSMWYAGLALYGVSGAAVIGVDRLMAGPQAPNDNSANSLSYLLMVSGLVCISELFAAKAVIDRMARAGQPWRALLDADEHPAADDLRRIVVKVQARVAECGGVDPLAIHVCMNNGFLP